MARALQGRDRRLPYRARPAKTRLDHDGNGDRGDGRVRRAATTRWQNAARVGNSTPRGSRAAVRTRRRACRLERSRFTSSGKKRNSRRVIRLRSHSKGASTHRDRPNVGGQKRIALPSARRVCSNSRRISRPSDASKCSMTPRFQIPSMESSRKGRWRMSAQTR